MKTSVLLKFLALPMLVVMLFAMGLGSAGAASPADTPDVTPVLVAGNPTCVGLGYDFGFKIDPPTPGVYNIDGVNTVNFSTSDGVYFNWTSTLGMDAVIVKGGNNANAYVYDPPAESFGDGGLHSPDNASGNPAAISHIEFCYDYELTASKTANATYTRTYTWTITKTVDDDTHVGFTGDSFVSNYDVVVDQTVTDSAFAVSGTITVNNPTPFPVSFSVADSVGGNAATVVCPTNTVAAGGSVVCTYSVGLGAKTDGTNVATVTSNTAGIDGATASANYAFGAPTTTVGYPTVNVTDSLGGALGSASGDKTFEYPVTFTCDEDEGNNPNTATIVETGQFASENVNVSCYELDVSKTAATSLTRTWTWDIEKTGDQTDLTLSLGQQFVVNYTVTVDATSADSDWAVAGEITVYNPAPIAATLNGVSDVVSPAIAATVDCGVTFPYSLAAGGTLTCDYSANLPNADARTNTATATLQNSPSGTTDFTGSAAVSFASPTVTEVDECIDVVDDQYGVLGTVCADELPKTFEYSLTVGPYNVCGDYSFINVASFVTNDTDATGSDDHTVDVNVPCATGCTLTQGYWKTHSLHGPAPYDDAWLSIGDKDGDGVVEGADETFYKSGKTWYQVFWTPPAGNPYYNLAHQYMAAYLNKVNGASTTPDVEAALTWSHIFFNTYTPSSKLDKSTRNTVLAMAAILDSYNNGLTGPGHCSE